MACELVSQPGRPVETDAPPEPGAAVPWPPGVPRPRWVFAGCLALFALLLIIHNTSLFTRAVHEDSDHAANSIMIFQAKRLRLLVGNYSRVGFYHPGPSILYVLAGSELLFRDLLGVVPARGNAHMLGALLLDALLVASSLAILHAHFRSLLAAATAVAVFLGYFGLGGQLADHWMPYLYFPPFLLLLVAGASVACGEARHLPWLALAGGLLVHGHICFVAFVLPLTLYALLGLARGHGFAVRRLLRLHAGSFLAFAALVGLFLLPIVVNTVWHYPGELGRYLDFARANARNNPHSLREVVPFVLLVLTGEAAHPGLITLSVLGAILATSPRPADGPRWRYTGHAMGVCGLATASMLYYAWRGVDSLQYTYVGIFFGSVLLLLVTIAALNAVSLFGTDRRRRAALACLVALVALAAASTGHFTNHYTGSPFLAEVADRLDAGEGADRPIVIFMNDPSKQWVPAIGLVAEMERRGRPIFAVYPGAAMAFTWRHVFGWETLADVRYLEFARPGERGRRSRNIVYENDALSIREVEHATR
jgi:hypothetical protein